MFEGGFEDVSECLMKEYVLNEWVILWNIGILSYDVQRQQVHLIIGNYVLYCFGITYINIGSL